MIVVKTIDWQPISSIPEDRKDGRWILLWSDGAPAAARWYQEPRFCPAGRWETEYSDMYGDTIVPEAPTHWSDINPPEEA